MEKKESGGKPMQIIISILLCGNLGLAGWIGKTTVETQTAVAGMAAKLETHNARIADLEQNAAPITRQFFKTSDARDTALEKDVSALKVVVSTINKLESSLELNSYKLDEVVRSHQRIEATIDELKKARQ